MKMTGFIIELFGNILLGTSIVYTWNNIYNQSFTLKRLRKINNIISILLIAISSCITTALLKQPFRIIIINIILLIINFIFVHKNIKEAIISTIISQIIINIIEFLFIIFFSTFFGEKLYEYLQTPIGIFSIDVYIIVVDYILLKLKILKYISGILKEIKDNHAIINSIIVIVLMFITTSESYMQLPIQFVLTANTTILLIFIYLIYKTNKTKNKYNNINNKYQTSITSLKEYETMIDKFRVNTHENKNELLTIRNMIKSNDKKTVEYIDKLVDNKIKDNEKIMYQTSKIPEGGLRATIYSKLCVMDKYKIKYKLDISKDVRTVDLINLDEELILNICKILGVFMDNAIEAVRNLKKREINIELYVIDDELYIDITNNFKGEIDLSKIGHERHTTKGEEHGYGLLLVNKIINDNKRYLENEKSINGNYFTQSLKIRLK